MAFHSTIALAIAAAAIAGPEEDLAAADAVLDVARAAVAAGQHGRFIELVTEARALKVGALGEEHVEVGELDAALSRAWLFLGDQDAADAARVRALAVLDPIEPPPVSLIRMHYNHGAHLSAQGGKALSIAPYELALAKVGALDPPDPGLHASILTNLAGSLRLTGASPERPLALMEEALAVRRAANDTGRGLGVTLGNLGDLYRVLGRFEDAIPPLREALAVTTALVGDEDPLVIGTAFNLALVQQDAGDLLAARATLEEAVATARRVLPPDDERRIHTLMSLGSVLDRLYEVVEARAVLEEARDLIAEHQDPDGPFMAQVLVALGRVEFHGSDPYSAVPLYRRALELLEARYGPDDIRLAGVLTSLAAVLHHRKAWDDVFELHYRAQKIREDHHGPEHPSVALGLHNIATALQEAGRLDESEQTFAAALAMRRKLLGDDSPHVAITLYSSAFVPRERGDWQAAKALFEQSLDIHNRVLPASHERVVYTQVDLAEVLLELGETERSLELFERAVQSLEQGLRRLDGLSERQGRLYITRARHALAGWLTLADKPEDAALAWTRAMGLKGAVAIRKRRALRAATPEAAQIAAELAEVKRALARVSGVGESAWRAEKIAELTPRSDALERELSRLNGDYQDERRRADATPDDLCVALDPDATLVDFFRTERFGSRYIAFVVDAECEPLRVDLGSAPEIDSAIAGWRALLSSPTGNLPRTRIRGDAVTERLLAPLLPHLVDTEKLIIVPDGALASVPFAALPLEDGRLIERMQVTYLDRAADVLVQQERSRGDALVVGGVDFGPKRESGGTPCAARSDWSPLPATGTESDAVGGAWRGSVTQLSGLDATVDAVRGAMAGKALIHVATHGVFATGDDCLQAGARDMDPMLLSGLVLAGANGGGGVLTAAEVADMDLSGAALVTLSACETGLGEIHSGEGVLGLRRGFSIAGAGSLLMSLWSVGDDSTARLMRDFYTNYRRGKRHPTEALRRAQLAAIRRGEPPFAWAAFVASGV